MNHDDTKLPRAMTTAPLCLRAFVVERICGKFMGEQKDSTPRQCSIVFATVSPNYDLYPINDQPFELFAYLAGVKCERGAFYVLRLTFYSL